MDIGRLVHQFAHDAAAIGWYCRPDEHWHAVPQAFIQKYLGTTRIEEKILKYINKGHILATEVHLGTCEDTVIRVAYRANLSSFPPTAKLLAATDFGLQRLLFRSKSDSLALHYLLKKAVDRHKKEIKSLEAERDMAIGLFEVATSTHSIMQDSNDEAST